MKQTANRKERAQILRAVEALLTDPAYADHWRGYRCLLTEPNFTWELAHMEEGASGFRFTRPSTTVAPRSSAAT